MSVRTSGRVPPQNLKKKGSGENPGVRTCVRKSLMGVPGKTSARKVLMISIFIRYSGQYAQACAIFVIILSDTQRLEYGQVSGQLPAHTSGSDVSCLEFSGNQTRGVDHGCSGADLCRRFGTECEAQASVGRTRQILWLKAAAANDFLTAHRHAYKQDIQK